MYLIMSTDYSSFEAALVSALGPLRLIAVSYLFCSAVGVEKFSGTVPSGCTLSRLASAGDAFYTGVCAFRPSELSNWQLHARHPSPRRTRGGARGSAAMADIGYVKMEEVPSIPRLSQSPECIYYAPLGKATVAQT